MRGLLFEFELEPEVAIETGLFQEFLTLFEGLPADFLFFDVFRVLDLIELQASEVFPDEQGGCEGEDRADYPPNHRVIRGQGLQLRADDTLEETPKESNGDHGAVREGLLDREGGLYSEGKGHS